MAAIRVRGFLRLSENYVSSLRMMGSTTGTPGEGAGHGGGGGGNAVTKSYLYFHDRHQPQP